MELHNTQNHSLEECSREDWKEQHLSSTNVQLRKCGTKIRKTTRHINRQNPTTKAGAHQTGILWDQNCSVGALSRIVAPRTASPAQHNAEKEERRRISSALLVVSDGKLKVK